MRYILLVVLLWLFSGLHASGDSYPFLEKALKYYQIEDSAGFDQNFATIRMHKLLSGSRDNFSLDTAFLITREIGLTQIKQGKYDIALDIFYDLQGYFESMKDPTLQEKKMLSAVLNIIGAIYEENGLWNDATDMYMQSLRVCEEIGYEEGKARIYNNLGKLYFTRHDLDKAEGLFLQAAEINQTLNIRSELFTNYNNLAAVYGREQKMEKALEYALIALNQLDLNGDYFDRSIVYSNLGNMYADIRNFPIALSYYHQALSIQKRKGYQLHLFNSLLSIARLYQLAGSTDSARWYIEQALTQSTGTRNPLDKMTVYKSAAEFYNHNKQYNKASVYFSNYILLKDSLPELNSLTRIEQIQSVHDVINKEKNNKILQQKIDLQQLALQRHRIILVGAIILVVFSGGFLVYLIRSNKREKEKNSLIMDQAKRLHQQEKELLLEKEQNLEAELDYKNRQLTSYTLHLVRNTEFILKTIEEIRQVVLELHPRDAQRIKTIRTLISDLQQYSTGNVWEEFRLYFEEVHQSFEKNLISRFPDLTSHDIKICALLRLGLSTKEIASITFREIRSVESARNRLRKKLELSPDASIQQFLLQF